MGTILLNVDMFIYDKNSKNFTILHQSSYTAQLACHKLDIVTNTQSF